MQVPLCGDCWGVLLCVSLCELLPWVTVSDSQGENYWNTEFQTTYSPSHRRKWKIFLDTWPHSAFAEENLNIGLSIGELANHKTTAEVMDIMNVELNFSVTYYQFQKRICFYITEVKKNPSYENSWHVFNSIISKHLSPFSHWNEKLIIQPFLVNGLSLSGLWKPPAKLAAFFSVPCGQDGV